MALPTHNSSKQTPSALNLTISGKDLFWVLFLMILLTQVSFTSELVSGCSLGPYIYLHPVQGFTWMHLNVTGDLEMSFATKR